MNFTQHETEIVLLDKSDCTEDLGPTALCYKLSVIDQGISERRLMVRAYHQTPSKGAVILTTGGFGEGYYTASYGQEAVDTFKTLYGAGLEVYEFKWFGSDGWGTNAEGYGYTKAVSAYTEVVKWMRQSNIISIDDSDLIFAHGNSGGALQIAYGLAMYGLDDYIHVAVLSGGPPVSDLRRGIFGRETDEARWTKNSRGMKRTDHLMGWKNKGNYCVSRGDDPHPLQTWLRVVERLDQDSLVSPTEPREYHYNTKVHFVQTDDEGNADHQAQIYSAVLTGPKKWHQINSITEHRVPATREGAQIIRDVILSEISK